MATDETHPITEEPGKMSPDEKPPIAEKEAPKEDELQQFVERARVAWLNPLQTLAETYGRRVRAIAESVLTSLENDDSPKKKA